MGSVDRRIEELERLLAESGEPRGPSRQMIAILNEVASLKASCADRWTGEKNMTRVEGENIPRKVLGPGYTHRDLWRLAVERASASEALPEEDVPRWTAVVFELFGQLSTRHDLDAVVESES
jgi:hypothetical protein